MCLKPVTITNPTERIAISGGQPLKLEVPCGKCAECKKAKRLEWHFRTYHECLDCVNKGGFIYYDTLTYAPEYLPMLSHFIELPESVTDFSCFNHTHWRNFLKNLRRQLDYHHKGVKFKYFLTSEYGTDDRYTHRPHYHILFFVFGTIDPYTFSSLVSSCWLYGRTDGLPYKTRTYVADNIFGRDLGINEHHNDYLKVTNYVSKYITKDSTFQETIDNRISLLQEHYDDETLKELRHNIDMFHRQSQGFGISYIHNLNSEEYDYIKKNNACRIKDSEKVVLTIPLPLYYNRKLFFKMLKNSDGKYFWQPTYDGSLHAYDTAIQSIRKTTNRIKSQLANLTDIEQQYINHLLDDRTYEDYAIYLLFYKGRCRDLATDYIQKLNFKYDLLTDNEYNLYDWLYTIHLTKYIHTETPDMYFLRDRDNNTLALPSPDNLFDNEKLIPYYNNLNNITFNENSCFAFRNFDLLTKALNSFTKDVRELKQQTFDFIENQLKKFKTYYE